MYRTIQSVASITRQLGMFGCHFQSSETFLILESIKVAFDLRPQNQEKSTHKMLEQTDP